jgi:hypothetical protein
MNLKKLVNDKELWDAFVEELDKRISLQHKGMEHFVEVQDLYKAQGAVQALKALKLLREQVNGKA